jgi:hypothetical protein
MVAPVVVSPVVSPTAPVDSATLAEKRIKESRCPICGKPVFRPKDGGLGSTCQEHQGKLRQHATEAQAVPEGFLKMSLVCRTLEDKGFKTSEIVRACGGDAATAPVLNEIFRPVYVGKRKYLDPRTITDGVAMLTKAREVKPVEKSSDKADAKPASKGVDTANALKKVVARK